MSGGRLRAEPRRHDLSEAFLMIPMPLEPNFRRIRPRRVVFIRVACAAAVCLTGGTHVARGDPMNPQRVSAAYQIHFFRRKNPSIATAITTITLSTSG